MELSTASNVIFFLLLFQLSSEENFYDVEKQRNATIDSDEELSNTRLNNSENTDWLIEYYLNNRYYNVAQSLESGKNNGIYDLWRFNLALDSLLPERKGAMGAKTSITSTTSAGITSAGITSAGPVGPPKQNANNLKKNNTSNNSNSVVKKPPTDEGIKMDTVPKPSANSATNSKADLYYNQMFDYRALKRKEGEESALHAETVQKFKSHPPPGPASKTGSSLPSRPSSVFWSGFNGG